MKTMNGRNGCRKRRSDRSQVLYSIVCDVTGEEYVGLTVSLGRARLKSIKSRWQKHVYHALVEGRSFPLQVAIREHGPENFSHELLAVVRGKTAAHELEREIIAERKPAFNVELVGGRKRVGVRTKKVVAK